MHCSLDHQLNITNTIGGVKMFVKNFFNNLGKKIKNFLSKSKSFFEKIWDIIRTFFLDNKNIFFGIFIALYFLMLLTMSSGLLFSGLEKKSSLLMAIGVAGYIVVLCFAFWIITELTEERENRQVVDQLEELQSKLCSNERNLSIIEGIIRKFSFDQKMANNEIHILLTQIYQSIKQMTITEVKEEGEEEVHKN